MAEIFGVQIPDDIEVRERIATAGGTMLGVSMQIRAFKGRHQIAKMKASIIPEHEGLVETTHWEDGDKAWYRAAYMTGDEARAVAELISAMLAWRNRKEGRR